MTRHGTHAGWVNGCRCTPCRDGHYRYQAKLRVLGDTSTVNRPVEPVKAHVEALRAAGMSLPQIRDVSGVSDFAVRSILSDRRAFVRGKTADAILAIPVSDRCRVEYTGIGVARRLWALAAMGWPQSVIAERCGTAQTYLAQISTHPARPVFPATYRRVAAVYAELSMRPGPSSRAKARALRAGWLPPLAWDDIDDPGERPNIEAITDTRRVVHVEDVAELTEQGATWDHLLWRLGVSRKTVERACAKDRGNRPDLLARLSRNSGTDAHGRTA